MAVRARVQDAVSRLGADFPGDVETGILDPEQAARFEEFANEEPCPVLDPATGLCDLYPARPITCRVFGPPLRTEEGLGVCELCFVGATDGEIAAAEVHLDCGALESELTAEAEQSIGCYGETIVAWALLAR
jgi:Fe-S-cluster containining protein